MAEQIRWRLPTLKEIGITFLIVLPIALILVIPLRIIKSSRVSGKETVKARLAGSEEEIRLAVLDILEKPELLPGVIKELEKAARHQNPEIRLLILDMLLTALPDEDSYYQSGVMIQLSSLVYDLNRDDPDKRVIKAAAECLDAWNI
jgi:hypothetical protein